MESRIEQQEKLIKDTKTVLKNETKRQRRERISDWIFGFVFIYLIACGIAGNIAWIIWLSMQLF